VAYTLLKNPKLQKLRGHAIAADQKTTSDEKQQSHCESDQDGKIDTENDKIELTELKQSV